MANLINLPGYAVPDGFRSRARPVSYFEFPARQCSLLAHAICLTGARDQYFDSSRALVFCGQPALIVACICSISSIFEGFALNDDEES